MPKADAREEQAVCPKKENCLNRLRSGHDRVSSAASGTEWHSWSTLDKGRERATLPPLNVKTNRSPFSHRRFRSYALGLMTALLCATSLARSVPSLTDAELGRGIFSKMHMLIEKTILAVDVATLEVRVDPKTEAAFESIAKGKACTQALESELARTMFGAQFAVFELRFLRGISLNQYVNGVRESLDDARFVCPRSPKYATRYLAQPPEG